MLRQRTPRGRMAGRAPQLSHQEHANRDEVGTVLEPSMVVLLHPAVRLVYQGGSLQGVRRGADVPALTGAVPQQWPGGRLRPVWISPQRPGAPTLQAELFRLQLALFVEAHLS